MRSWGKVKLCLTSGPPSSISCFWKEPTLGTSKEWKAIERAHHYVTEDSCLTCLNNIFEYGCWSQREQRASLKMLQELLVPTERHSTVCWFLCFVLFYHFQILMSSYNKALQEMTAAPTGKSHGCQQPESLRGSSLFSAFTHIGLAHKLAHSKLQAWSCQHIKLEC